MENIRIGSELWIDGSESAQRVDGLMRTMKENGLTIARVFVMWHHIQPIDGPFAFEVYDNVFAAAEKHGVKVVPTLTALFPPIWTGVPSIGTGWREEQWHYPLSYIEAVVSRYAGSDTLDSWILWNEPTLILEQTPNTLKDYLIFLRENGCMEQKEALEQRMQLFGIENLGKTIHEDNWCLFTVQCLNNLTATMASAVKKADPVHEVHVNPHNIASMAMATGQDLWEQAKVVDFLGCSAHPVWHATRFARNRLHQAVAMFADLVRSASRHPDGRFWVTELQSGPTTLSGVWPYEPTEADIRMWTWESIASGAKAVVYWCLNVRHTGVEAGEWGLLDLKDRPTGRMKVAREIAGMLERHQALFTQTSPPEPDVYILWPRQSLLLGWRAGEGLDVSNPRNRQMAADAVAGAYLMCSDMGLESVFVMEEDLHTGKLPRGSVLIVPGTQVLEERDALALLRHAETGGRVIADGLCGLYGPQWTIGYDNLKHLDRLFGAEFIEACGFEGDLQVEVHQMEEEPNGKTDSWSIPLWYARAKMKADDTTAIVSWFPDGWPAIMTNRIGEGSAIRIAASLFQRYLTKPETSALACLRAWMVPSAEKRAGMTPSTKMILLNPSASLQLRSLMMPESGSVAILLNAGSLCNACLSLPVGFGAEELDGADLSAGSDDVVTLAVSTGAVRLFHVKKMV